MPDFRRWTPGGEPAPDAVARTDRLIDAIAAEQPVPLAEAGDAVIAALLTGWRDEVREPPATALVSPRDAVAALRSGLASRRRTRMGFAVVGSVAAALLCVGGFGAVIYGAGPGDSLYGLRTTLFGEPRAARNDQVELAAQTELDQVQNLIAQGQWQQAQATLAAVTTTVATVDDGQAQQNLLQQWNRLNVQVEARDPNATPPPGPTSVILPGGSTVTLPALDEASPTSSSDAPTISLPSVSPTSSPGQPPESSSSGQPPESSSPGESPESSVPGQPPESEVPASTTPTTAPSPTTTTTPVTTPTPMTTTTPVTTPTPVSTTAAAASPPAGSSVPSAPDTTGTPATTAVATQPSAGSSGPLTTATSVPPAPASVPPTPTATPPPSSVSPSSVSLAPPAPATTPMLAPPAPATTPMPAPPAPATTLMPPPTGPAAGIGPGPASGPNVYGGPGLPGHRSSWDGSAPSSPFTTVVNSPPLSAQR